MISFEVKGDLKSTKTFLNNAKDINNTILLKSKIKSIADAGAVALKNNTPIRTGKTANSWNYDIENTKDKIIVSWNNDNIIKGINIAIIIQYGHGTKNGGYVKGVDYINPALKPIFDEMANDMWKVVTSS